MTSKDTVSKDELTSTVMDYKPESNNDSCIIYKFQSRPPYEGFILILLIVLIAILFIWWLNNKN